MSILALEDRFSVVVSAGSGKNKFYRTFELTERTEPECLLENVLIDDSKVRPVAPRFEQHLAFASSQAADMASHDEATLRRTFWAARKRGFRCELMKFVYPQYRLWSSVLEKTAIPHFRSWHVTPRRELPETRKAHRKALRHRLLFASYSRGWYKKIKQVPFVASRPAVGGPTL